MNNNSSIVPGLFIQFLFLTVSVLIIFFPTLHAQVSLIDDVDMLNWLLNSESSSTKLHQILFPGSAHGGYYRPLVGLSFWFDKILFNVDPFVMHLEGVLLHLFNIFLVFIMTRECLVLLGKNKNQLFPLIAGLLFGLHPVTTESVNWISGRTDIIMGNFVLLGTIMLIHYKRVGHIRYLILALFAVLIGGLAKEAAFGCLAGGIFLFTARCSENYGDSGITDSQNTAPVFDIVIFYSIAFLAALFWGYYWIVLLCLFGYLAITMYRCIKINPMVLKNSVKPVLILLMVMSFSVALFILLRRLVFISDDGKIGNTLRLMLVDTNYSISLFTGAFGFYIKKFISPWPLNFFILEIDPLYDFVGIAVLLIMMRLLTKNTISTALFFVGVGLVVPVLPFVFGTIAWTSYAERYIYLPSAFWSSALAVQAAKMYEIKFYGQRAKMKWAVTALFLAVMIVFSITSWKRNVVWQKNVTLLQDTVEKSPMVKPLRDFYMAALFYVGRYEDAAEQYEIGRSLYSRTYDPAPDLMMGKILQNRHKFNDAYRLYQKVNTITGFKSEPSLYAMISFLEHCPREASFCLSKLEIQKQILLYRSMLNKLHENSCIDNYSKQIGSHS